MNSILTKNQSHRIAVAIVFASSVLYPMLSVAQSCKFEDIVTGPLSIGQIVKAGDLRIKFLQLDDRQIDRRNNVWYATVDMKAPKLELHGVLLDSEKPKTFNICGQEVTVTFRSEPYGMGAFIVSTF